MKNMTLVTVKVLCTVQSSVMWDEGLPLHSGSSECIHNSSIIRICRECICIQKQVLEIGGWWEHAWHPDNSLHMRNPLAGLVHQCWGICCVLFAVNGIHPSSRASYNKVWVPKPSFNRLRHAVSYQQHTEFNHCPLIHMTEYHTLSWSTAQQCEHIQQSPFNGPNSFQKNNALRVIFP